VCQVKIPCRILQRALEEALGAPINRALELTRQAKAAEAKVVIGAPHRCFVAEDI